jgi:hypothetical protein
MSDVDPQPFIPDYASYNWTGAPANGSLQTNVLGGDSRMFTSPRPPKAEECRQEKCS